MRGDTIPLTLPNLWHKIAILMPKLEETARLERAQPEGFGRLATCWINHFPTSPKLSGTHHDGT